MGRQGERPVSDRHRVRSGHGHDRSDNDAISALWKRLGDAKTKGFLAAAGMTETVPGADGYRSLTQENVTAEQKLLQLGTAKNSVLSGNSRSYATS